MSCEIEWLNSSQSYDGGRGSGVGVRGFGLDFGGWGLDLRGWGRGLRWFAVRVWV
jgi:hypothetical protein